MLARWLTFITSLAASANLESANSARGSVTVTPTNRVKGEPEQELVLGCGDGKYAGVVQFWHTPFGDLQTSALHTNLDPVFLHHNGSLLIPSCSIHHSGLYYCILRHAEGSTLWPYELHVGHHHQNGDGKDAGCSARRLRRSVRPQEAHPAEVSDELFAGAVAAAVLLTFVVGFSAGALTRTHVLRCLRGVTMRLQLPKKRRQTDTPDHSSQVTMATLPPMYDNQSFETEVMRNDSPTRGTPETTASVTTPSPPAKPQRSFRHKREEEPETTAYLEGCEYKQENIDGEEVAEKDVKEVKEKSNEEVMDEKETTELPFHLLEVEGIQSEADEDNCREKDGESREERTEEAAGEQESRSTEEVMRDEHDAEQITEEVKETEKCEELEQTSTESEDKRSSKNEMKTDTEEEERSSSAPRHSSRVIRLYQYDEEGQRYSHLPEPGCEDPEPAARLKRRSLSLTRLNAIMAAASAGPMDGKETGGQQSEAPLHFHMEI